MLENHFSSRKLCPKQRLPMSWNRTSFSLVCRRLHLWTHLMVMETYSPIPCRSGNCLCGRGSLIWCSSQLPFLFALVRFHLPANNKQSKNKQQTSTVLLCFLCLIIFQPGYADSRIEFNISVCPSVPSDHPTIRAGGHWDILMKPGTCVPRHAGEIGIADGRNRAIATPTNWY